MGDVMAVQEGFSQWDVVKDLDAAVPWPLPDDWAANDMSDTLERMARGEKPTLEGVSYSDGDAWNARFASAMRVQNATTVVADLQQSFANYKRAATAIPDDRYGDGKTINRMLETSGYGHYRDHLPEIKAFASKVAGA